MRLLSLLLPKPLVGEECCLFHMLSAALVPQFAIERNGSQFADSDLRLAFLRCLGRSRLSEATSVENCGMALNGRSGLPLWFP